MMRDDDGAEDDREVGSEVGQQLGELRNVEDVRRRDEGDEVDVEGDEFAQCLGDAVLAVTVRPAVGSTLSRSLVSPPGRQPTRSCTSRYRSA